MRSATREALGALTNAVQASSGAGVAHARELLQAARAIERTPQLLAALVDANGAAADRQAIVERVFGALGADARRLLGVAVAQRWSSGQDLLAGLEDAGIRLAAIASDADVASEIHQFEGIVAGDADLELALGGLLGEADDKARVVERLLAGRASESTLVILDHLVRSPRGRRIGALLRQAAETVADAAGAGIATVTTAVPLPETQLRRLEASLAQRYGRRLQVQQVVDPTIIGGLRVAVADDVIDGTIRAKFTDLRLRLA
ncbi:F0F1 ATP synthase subunit delta [Agrococcus sp. SGAir0287]|uniref:F0F1 ATP synthase subunit delta n=1 Tax=Agrococcus sp. SGAir0287 TaxID=2070347 RepID=UPI0010CD1B72|nr:F0F1 ATP synthase subunit delta [Agrococcus sp. SGAir0287]QCR19683.1 F0F1 ATP synthase subunit delta [Agrococcus sp. SGAir0287]